MKRNNEYIDQIDKRMKKLNSKLKSIKINQRDILSLKIEK